MVDALGATRYVYDAVGQVLSEDGPWANDTASCTYANRLRTGMSLMQPGAGLWNQCYTYDKAGNVYQVNDGAVKTFGVNSLNGNRWGRVLSCGQLALDHRNGTLRTPPGTSDLGPLGRAVAGGLKPGNPTVSPQCAERSQRGCAGRCGFPEDMIRYRIRESAAPSGA